jgi:hypothetical protein
MKPPCLDVSHPERPFMGSLDLALMRGQQHMPPARAVVRPRNSPDRIDARPAARDGERQEFASCRECPDVRNVN